MEKKIFAQFTQCAYEFFDFADHHINVTSPGPNAANSAAAAAVASYSTAQHIMMGAGPGSPGLFQSSPSKFHYLLFVFFYFRFVF